MMRDILHHVAGSPLPFL